MTEHKPYIPAEAKMPEFTLSAVLLGTSLGLIFAASSLYLVLKVGMTVSASIPVAVLAITLFRAFSKMTGLRQATILENNIVQTAGSAGESIAFGVGVTMPTLLLLGFDMDLTRIMVVSVLGGILGILAMIPLRRAFIVKMHGRPGEPGTLLYPEGTACAQVLISGEKGGATGKTVFIGFGLAFAHKFITEGMALLQETVKVPFAFINRTAVFAQAMASELIGVGYIIGYKTSAIMMAGAVLGYLIVIPTIFLIGEHAPGIIKPGDRPIAEMSISQIRNNYLLFIGAGCVASAGILSMLKTMPMIIKGVAGSIATARAGGGAGGAKLRTEDDMPMSVVFLGSLGLIVLLTVFLAADVGLLPAVAGACLVVLFGFLFVTVSARLTGEIGSSSNPISGMTTATLMLTCLIFLALGWQSSTERLLALSIAAVVCIASSNGGTTAQSLKTGFLVGGTPKYMQYAILVGALVSALVIGGTLIGFNEARTVLTKKAEHIPDIVLMKTELDRLPTTATHEGKTYKVWHTRNDKLTTPDADTNYVPRKDALLKVKPGVYYVDPETGKVAYKKDNAIMGELEYRDDGTYVKREFEAPKTQVMGIVINGVLKGDLDWAMIGIGCMITLMLELCGVSALAFAVGVYVPIQYSAPIFVGGIVRFFVDKYLARQSEAEAVQKIEAAIAAAGTDPVARMQAEKEAKAQAEIDAIKKSETSGGVLLASGYIAGGSLAGVLIGFLAFSDDLPDDLRSHEHRTARVVAAAPFDAVIDAEARRQLGIPADQKLDPPAAKRLEAMKKELKDLNGELPTWYSKVPAGTTLRLPQGLGDYKAEKEMTLRDIAVEKFGSNFLGKPRERYATKIAEMDANKETLKAKQIPATAIPEGTELKLPTVEWPAWIGLAFLVGFLLLVGMGVLFPPPKEDQL